MKILVSDFDGTLLDKNFEENIKFVQKFVNAGNVFIIATGRNITSLKKVISSYDIPFSYLIHNDGGIIVDKNYREIMRFDLEENLCKELYSLLKKSCAFSSVFFDTGYVYQTQFTKHHNRIIGKIIDRKESKKVLYFLYQRYDKKIYAYLSNNWINITSGENNKLSAIKWLIKKNTWNSKQVYTVGDEQNDVEMLTTYHGFCIGNKILNEKIVKIDKFIDIEKLL